MTDFHQQCWFYNNEDNNSHDPLCLLSFVRSRPQKATFTYCEIGSQVGLINEKGRFKKKKKGTCSKNKPSQLDFVFIHTKHNTFFFFFCNKATQYCIYIQ